MTERHVYRTVVALTIASMRRHERAIAWFVARKPPATTIMSRVIFLCPTHRNYREIGHLNGARRDALLFHDYATLALEEPVTEEPTDGIRIPDPEADIESIVRHCREVAVDCIVSTDHYPGSTLASIVARALGLPGVDPSVNLLCQHKYHARRALRAVVPEATPAFESVADERELTLPAASGFVSSSQCYR